MLERIYIGRRFKNDTERLEKLFELYTKMTAAAKAEPVVKEDERKKHERQPHQPDATSCRCRRLAG